MQEQKLIQLFTLPIARQLFYVVIKTPTATQQLFLNSFFPFVDETQSTVLKTYETAKFGLDDYKMEIVNQIFIATISGDKITKTVKIN